MARDRMTFPRAGPTRPPPGGSARGPRLLDRFREALRSRRYSRRTEQTYDIRTVLELLGRSNVKTTMIYTHVLNRGPAGDRSPVDAR